MLKSCVVDKYMSLQMYLYTLIQNVGITMVFFLKEHTNITDHKILIGSVVQIHL